MSDLDGTVAATSSNVVLLDDSYEAVLDHNSQPVYTGTTLIVGGALSGTISTESLSGVV